MCEECIREETQEDEAFTRALICKARATGRSIDEIYDNWRRRSATARGKEPISPS